MKSTRTIKNLLGAGLLFFSGSVFSFAQSNGAAVNPSTAVTSQGKSYSLFVNESRSGLIPTLNTTVSTTGSLILGELKKLEGKLITDVNIPAGTPLGSTVLLTFDGKPFWHVTVADILGQDDGEGSDQPVSLRPIDIEGLISGGGASTGTTNPNATSTPEVSTGSPTTSGIGKNQPKMDLYPNPATDQITIVTEGEVLWGVTEVIDITGKKILEVPIGSNIPATGIDRLSITVSQLKPGTYFLRFKTDKDIYTKRFQVAR